MFTLMHDRDIQSVGKQALAALMRSDWNAFRRFCAPQIVFCQYTRAYRGDYKGGNDYNQAFQSVLFPLNTEREGFDHDYVVSLTVDMSAQPSKETITAFRQFCREGRRAWGPEIGPNVQAEEAKMLFGPAIEAKIASNYKWRVEFEDIAGEWKVRSLILQMH